MEEWQTDKSIIETNQFLINNKILSDVSFHFLNVSQEAEIIYAHSFMLSKRSEVFFAQFNGSLKKPEKVMIEDATKETFLSFMNYLYTDIAQITCENVAELFYLGNKYLVKGLQKRCEMYVDNNISLDNFLTITKTSIKLFCEDLIDICSVFIETHCFIIVKMEQFLKIELHILKFILNLERSSCDEIILFRSVLKWAEIYCKENNMKMKELTDVFQLIRFPTMSLEEFGECAKYNDIFESKAEIGSIFCFINKNESESDDEYDELPFKKIKREFFMENVSFSIPLIPKYFLNLKQLTIMLTILVYENCFLTGVKFNQIQPHCYEILKAGSLLVKITNNHFETELPLVKNTEYTFNIHTSGVKSYAPPNGFTAKFNNRNIFKVILESNLIKALDFKVQRK